MVNKEGPELNPVDALAAALLKAGDLGTMPNAPLGPPPLSDVLDSSSGEE